MGRIEEFGWQLNPGAGETINGPRPNSRGAEAAQDPPAFTDSRALEAENIESRPVWKPMHLQPVFGGRGAESREQRAKGMVRCRVVGGAVSEDLFQRGLCLPSGTQMTEVDLKRVVSVIINCRK